MGASNASTGPIGSGLRAVPSLAWRPKRHGGRSLQHSEPAMNETIQALQELVWQAETSRRPRTPTQRGGHWLDQLLPAGGRRGTLLGLLAIPGGGATALALNAARAIG